MNMNFLSKHLHAQAKKTRQGISDYGFINTTNILHESTERTNSRSDTVKEKSGKENNDVPLYSRKSMCLTAATSTPNLKKLRSDSPAINT